MEDYIKVALDLNGLVVVGQRSEQDCLTVDVSYATSFVACPHCGRPTNKVYDRRPQRKKDIPIQGQRLNLVLWRRRFRCLWCVNAHHRQRVFSEPNLAWGLGPKGRSRRTTPRLRDQIAQELPHQTVKRVAEVFEVGQRFVRECFAHRAKEQINAQVPEGYTPQVLGIDEFSMKKGQRYETVLCDLQERRVVEVLEGREGEKVEPFLKKFCHPWKVRVVVMDMSEAYRQVVELCLPRAIVVVDRFHVVQRVGKALDQVRLRLQRERGEERKGELYRMRYALRRNPADWTEEEKGHLEELFGQLPELETAWLLKEQFRVIYEAPERQTAETWLAAWEQAVEQAGLAEYKALFVQGSLMGSWRQEMLNYFEYRYTNGYVEGKNNRTKQLQRQAYGYRNRENLRLRVLLPATSSP